MQHLNTETHVLVTNLSRRVEGQTIATQRVRHQIRLFTRQARCQYLQIMLNCPVDELRIARVTLILPKRVKVGVTPRFKMQFLSTEHFQPLVDPERFV